MAKEIQVTEEQLLDLIREGVEKLHRKSLIENRLEQINQELNALNNPGAWEDAHKEAQNQLRKKTIAFNNMIPREKLMNESIGDIQTMTLEELIKIAKNAGEIVPDAEADLNSLGVAAGNRGIPVHKVEEILANYDMELDDVSHERSPEDEQGTWSLEDLANKGLLETNAKADVADIMGRAAKLMAEAKKRYQDISKK